MRASIRICSLIGVVLALLAPCAAQADITPIPKPPEGTGEPSVGRPDPVVAPLPRPQVQVPVQQAPAHTQTPVETSTPAETSGQPAPSEPALAVSEGGRELPVAPELSEGGREVAGVRSSLLATLVPTPLALVGLHESLPSYETYPAWLLGLFTLLATAEAFLLTHIWRGRRAAVAEANDLDDLNRL